MNFEDKFRKFNITEDMQDRFGLQAIHGVNLDQSNPRYGIKTVFIGEPEDKLIKQGVANVELE